MTIREQLTQEIQETSDVLKEEVLDFLLFLKSRKNQANEPTNLPQTLPITQSLESSKPSERPIWSIFEEAAENLPEEILADLPTDGSTQHDH